MSTNHPVDSRTRTCCGGIGSHTPECTTTTLHIKRMPLPTRLASDAHNGLLNVFDTYAQVSCGALNAEVVRFSYWDARDGRPDVEQTYEVRMNGMPEDHGGTCELYSTNPDDLRDLAAVCAAAALLLDEARQASQSQGVSR